MTSSDARVDALLREAASRGGPPGACPGDEALARWPEVDWTVMRHLETCLPCRELVAIQTEPVPEALRLRSARRPSRRPWIVTGLALAAGLALFLLRPPTPTAPEYGPAIVSGGVAAVRGDTAPSARFLPQSELKLRFDPRSPTSMPRVRVFATAGDAPWRPVEVRIDVGEGGVFQVVAGAEALFGVPQGRERLAVVACAGSLPDTPVDVPGCHVEVLAVDYHAEAR